MPSNGGTTRHNPTPPERGRKMREMTTDFPILRGEPLRFAFGTADQLGLRCSCPAHITSDKRTVLISVDSEAFGMLVMPIVEERPKGCAKREAFAIAVEHVEGAVREVFSAHYEPLEEISGEFDRERVGLYAMNEVSMQLVLRSIPDNIIYLRAWDDAVSAMKVEAELRKQQKSAKQGAKANTPPKAVQ